MASVRFKASPKESFGVGEFAKLSDEHKVVKDLPSVGENLQERTLQTFEMNGCATSSRRMGICLEVAQFGAVVCTLEDHPAAVVSYECPEEQ
eukprot:2852991-Amphidinium_carterae.1